LSSTLQTAETAPESAPGGAVVAPASSLRTDLSAVNELAIELAALPPGESVQGCISERLRDLSGAVVVAFNDFDPVSTTLMTSYLAAPKGILDAVTGSVGKRMIGQVYPVGDWQRQQMLEHTIAFPGDLHDITFGRIPAPVAGAAQRLLGIDRFLSLSYAVRDELYGLSMLALGPRTPDPAPELLEAIAAVGAVSLCRRRAEAALYAMNAGLEKRIAERTRALERANLDLSQANRLYSALNADLEQTVHLLDEATRAKSDFLARMSHELRTPLNSIIGFSGTMLSGLAGTLTEEQERQLAMISTSGKHLLGLVNELLDVRRIEAGQTDVVSAQIDPLAAASKALSTVEPMAHQKGLVLTFESAAVGNVVTDGQRLEQVLLNLLGNAVKFTDMGGIVLRVSGEGDGVCFEVADTGTGIAPELQDKVFEEFYRAPLEDGSVREGSGLGLPLTKLLLDTIHGKITLTSRVGEGSTFRVWIPQRMV
jgi:signal transduction histidine kinase